MHFLSLWGAHRLLRVDFVVSQTTATWVAMTSNYALNNILTYRDRRRRGLKLLTGRSHSTSYVGSASLGMSASRTSCSKGITRGGWREALAPSWVRCGTTRRVPSSRGVGDERGCDAAALTLFATEIEYLTSAVAREKPGVLRAPEFSDNLEQARIAAQPLRMRAFPRGGKREALVCPVNAHHLRNASGCKGDVLDCQWLQQFKSYGLLSGAFSTGGLSDETCAIRSVVRNRKILLRYWDHHIQHMQFLFVPRPLPESTWDETIQWTVKSGS